MTLLRGRILCDISQRYRTRGYREQFRRIMKRATAFLTAGAFLALGVFTLAGCETGRVNKLHSHFESVSDVSTVPHPTRQYSSVATGNPPVPGSPTAAGPNGMQPENDSQARRSPGTEKGIAMAPRRQPEDRFVRQQ